MRLRPVTVSPSAPRLRKLALTVVFGLAAGYLPAHASPIDSIRSSISSLWGQKASRQQKAQQAWQQARAYKLRAGSIHDQLERTQQAFEVVNASYQNIAMQTKRTEANIVRTRHRIHITTARYNRRRILYGRRLAAIQRSGKFSYLQLFLGSRSLSDLTRRVYLFRVITDRDAELQNQIEADRNELQLSQNSLMAQWHQRNDLKQKSFREWLRVAQVKSRQQRLMKELNASRYEQVAYAQAQEQSSREIEQMIRGLTLKRNAILSENARREARRLAALQAEQQPSYSPPSPAVSRRYSDEPVRFAGGGWAIPARGRLSSRFGMRFHPVLHRYKLHTGDDFAAPMGAPIRAARAGQVIFAGWKTAYGNCVIIDHGNGITTLYGHASRLGVSTGQSVSAGQYIGNVGSTGWSTGPHLHFEVRRNGTPVDPTGYLYGR